MARIDKFIEAKFKHGGDSLYFSPGEKIGLKKGGARHALSTQPIEGAQIRAVLLEVLPTNLQQDVQSARPVRFNYLSPSGAVSIAVQPENDHLSIEVTVASLEMAGANGADGASSSGTSAPVSSDGTSAPTSSLGTTSPTDLTLAPVVSSTQASASVPARSGDAPLIDRLMRKMVENDCSDLHLCAGYPALFRKDGDIADLGGEEVLQPADVEALLHGISSDRVWDEFLDVKDVDYSYEIDGCARFRCNMFFDRSGMGGVFRVIPTIIPSASDLGLPPAVLNLTELHKGLVVVTGPTGSGKSTTLAAMVDHINRKQSRHIITIEDPIEFVHPRHACLINQREIGHHTSSFRAALRAALREDPDIVLLGEMRDLETVEIALETAETGHLVFGTLHTNTAASTVDRIIDQFSSDQQSQIRVLLSETLKGVIAQTLCKRKGGGRIAAHEILLVNSAISNLIREGKTYQIPSLMQTGRGSGMKTMDMALLEHIQSGAMEAAEGYSKSLTRKEFASLCERNSISLPKAA